MVGYFREWVTGFLKYLGKMALFILILALAAVLYQYLTCPVYRFPESRPFAGDQIYNPYNTLDTSHWRKANFQVQSYAWAGLTDGRKNTNQVIDSVYRFLGYDIIATSDYQRINRWGSEKESFIPVYEHGYGLFKNHQVLIGARQVTWADFPLYQNTHHKQHILHKLRKNNELVYIAHPGLRGGYEPEDMKYLTGYNGLEVLNYAIVSEAHWDTALSAGRYVTILGNDDSHDVSNPLEVGHRCTFIQSASLHGDSIVKALKQGKAYGADIFREPDFSLEEIAERSGDIARLTSVRVSRDTMIVKVDREARLFRFVGQGGAVRQRTENADSAVYVFRPEDTYIRTEILFPDRNLFYLNPLVRCDGGIPSNPPMAEVDRARSWLFWIVGWSTLAFILFNIYYFHLRWRKKRWSPVRFITKHKYRKYLFLLILLSLAVKATVAILLELGNDEVYYWTYALFPDLSHFDHPPMVGWMIQFFTLDLLLQDEFFLRLPGMVLGVLNIMLVYLIGKTLRDARTGWMAALLYTASIYCFVLSGLFILPDTPQVLFWLLAVYFFIKPLTGSAELKGNREKMLFAGAAVGFALLSKYTSVYLWIGAVLFIAFYNRKWLKSVYLYASMFLSAIIFLPVVVWNIRNDFISFAFHGGRAGFFDGGLRWDFFLTEITGEVLYNNPLVFVLIVIAAVALARGARLLKDSKAEVLILFWSVPLILTILLLSLFRQTLPHWTGPAYTTLIFLAAAWLTWKQEKRVRKRALSWYPAFAVILLLVILILGVLQVNYGILYTGSEEDKTQRGRHDVSMDMYGWEQVRGEFRWLASDDESRGVMPEGAPIVTFRWFPAANLDYYVARYTNKQVLAYGPLDRVHKYAWINEVRGGFREGMDAYYITTSRDYKAPEEVFGDAFESMEEAYYFPIKRGGKVAAYGFIFHLKGYQKR